MKILYAIQGTGNGHLSRARDIIPILQQKSELDILVSGIQADVELPYPVKYRLRGLSFIFGKTGGIDVLSTIKRSNIPNLIREIKKLPVEEYDLVLNDFEPVSAWACKLKKVKCIGLSHQSAVINPKSPKPKHFDLMGQLVLNHYAPVKMAYGFHFKNYDHTIFTPVIRTQIREAKPTIQNHYTVYLPAYDDAHIINVLGELKDCKWQVFSKHSKAAYVKDNVTIQPITNDVFIKSLIHSKGVLCGAGFETPAEALYLKKKLLVIPMKGQYEQHCNAAALKEMGVPVLKSLNRANMEQIKSWTNKNRIVPVRYEDETEMIISNIIGNHFFESGYDDDKNYYIIRKKINPPTMGEILRQRGA
jgi:uncharacterized protein (TIGR00661 family)